MKPYFKKWLNFYTEEQQERIAKYRLVGTEERAGETYALIQVVGKSTTLKKPVLEIDNEFSKNFPISQRWYLGVIHSFEARGLKNQIKEIPISALYSYKCLPIISMLFVMCLIMANLASFKVSQIFSLVFPSGLIFFPCTYIFDNILTEVYGYKQSRRVIWTGILCSMILIIGIKISVMLPAAACWHDQAAYTLVMDRFPRTVVASIIGYFCGEFLNSYTLAKLKILTMGKAYWLRLIASTIVGSSIDSIFFSIVAFAFILPMRIILSLIVTQYVVKVGYEVIAIPITYVFTGFLKKLEHIDYYDYHTNFTPFSLSLDDTPKRKQYFLVSLKSAC